MERYFSGLLFIWFASLANAQAPIGTCEMLKGSTFISVSDHPIGEGLKGTVYGKLSIVFDQTKSQLVAREADYFVRGEYRCDDAEGFFVVDKGTAGKWAGNFQPDSKVILFQGSWYRQTN